MNYNLFVECLRNYSVPEIIYDYSSIYLFYQIYFIIETVCPKAVLCPN